MGKKKAADKPLCKCHDSVFGWVSCKIHFEEDFFEDELRYGLH